MSFYVCFSYSISFPYERFINHHIRIVNFTKENHCYSILLTFHINVSTLQHKTTPSIKRNILLIYKTNIPISVESVD